MEAPMQLSFIPVLDEARLHSVRAPMGAAANDVSRNGLNGSLGRTMAAPRLSEMARANRPTDAQVHYLKKLTRIRTDSQLTRYVMRKLNKANDQQALKPTQITLTKADFAKVIDMEVNEKRLTG
jgi:hypothetical protein